VIDFGNGENSDNVQLDLSNGSSGCPIIGILNYSSFENFSPTSNALPLNTWVHLAGVLNGTIASIYINGTYNGNTVQYIPRDIIRASNFVGKSNWARDSLADARFKNIRIYNRSLSEFEILIDMDT